jgi:molybdopterin-guanine dinucleotide biosynthesis protein A
MNTPQAPFEDATGAVLIGGRSKRLGRDKVILTYGEKPLAAFMHGLLQDLFGQVLLVGHTRHELDALGLVSVPDAFPGKGVLGGIYTALTLSSEPYVFVTGADMPFLTPGLITRILDLRHAADAVIPRGVGGFEPLCAVYSKSCTEKVRQSLDEGVLKILPALEGLAIESPVIIPAPGDPDPFFNINTVEDWEKLQS